MPFDVTVDEGKGGGVHVRRSPVSSSGVTPAGASEKHTTTCKLAASIDGMVTHAFSAVL